MPNVDRLFTLDRLVRAGAPVARLERLTKAIALLDAILEPEWDYRTYSFNGQFDEAAGQRLASMRNGQGDEWLLAFAPEGAFLKGFVHDSAMAGLKLGREAFLAGLPSALEAFGSEPAFELDSATFCAWTVDAGTTWSRVPVERLVAGAGEAAVERAQAILQSPDPDGSVGLLAILDGDPESYRRYALEYFEEDLPLDALRAIYDGRPLTRELVHRIDPDRSLDDLESDLDEIGWPRADVN